MDSYSLSFAACYGLGPKSFLKLYTNFEDLEKAWMATQTDFEDLEIGKKTFENFDSFRKSFDIKKYQKILENRKIDFVSYFDKEYPKDLKKLESPPIGLFLRGNKSLLSKKSIAVVGTRKYTNYGKTVTESIVEGLMHNKIVITSGLALGIDAISHKAALDNNGFTIAVLGCGIDCLNPRENERLGNEIIEKGGLIVSEYGIGMSANAGTFPARNRIIAALSLGVLVTEAATGSGSLITAEYAIKLNKKVFAVPGLITNRMADGTLELLKKGAMLTTGSNDILEFLKINPKTEEIKKMDLSKNEIKIVSLLENEELSFDELVKKTKLSLSQIMPIVSKLELLGILTNISGKVSLKK